MSGLTPIPKSKRSGKRCRHFASKGKLVCRIHGGKSTGAKTKKGKHRQRIASWKHGLRSIEALEEAKRIREMLKECKSIIYEYC